MNEVETIPDLLNRINEIKRLLRERILSLPDNPRIKRIPGAVNCFTVKLSQLGKGMILSPEYHDFKVQYRKFVESLEKKHSDQIILFAAEAVKKGYFYPVGEPTRNRVILHPDVVQYLKEVFNFVIVTCPSCKQSTITLKNDIESVVRQNPKGAYHLWQCGHTLYYKVKVVDTPDKMSDWLKENSK